MTEKRRHARRPADDQIHVFWTDAQGRYWQEKVPVNDISLTGLRVALRNRIEARTQVGIRSAADSATTSARVRHVRQSGLRFLAGLELPTPESPSRG
jgi:hypothetical protein